MNKILKRIENGNYRDIEVRNIPQDEMNMWLSYISSAINAKIEDPSPLFIYFRKNMKGVTEKEFGEMVEFMTSGKIQLPAYPKLTPLLLSEIWSNYCVKRNKGKVGMQFEKEANLSPIEKEIIEMYYKAKELFMHFDLYKERSNYSYWKTEKGFSLAVKIGIVSISQNEMLEEYERIKDVFIQEHQDIDKMNPEATAYKQFQEIKDDMFLSLDKEFRNKNEYYIEIIEKVRDSIVKTSLEGFNDDSSILVNTVNNKINSICLDKLGFPIGQLIGKVNSL